MNKFNKMTILNLAIIMTLPLSIMNGKIDNRQISTNVKANVKELSTTKITTNISDVVVAEKVDTIEEKVEEKIEEPEKNDIMESQKVEDNEQIQEETIEENVVEDVVEEPVINEPTYVTYTGKQSFYDANCTGCSGVTSTGIDVSDGRVLYNDPTYGNVRIIAAGPEIRKWSIVKINGTRLGDNVLAIVLDRGGNIGADRKFLIDILTNSQENYSGISKNVTVEVLRDGK